MPLAEAKIDAQKILLYSHKTAVFVTLFTVFLKMFLTFALFLCLYSLKILPTFRTIWENIYLKIICCTLFILAGICSVQLYALADFSEKRWFYKNTTVPRHASDYFRLPRMRHIFKISFLFWLRQLLRAAIFFLYLTPLLLGCGGLYYALRTTDVPIAALFIFLGTLLCMLPLCTYFGFAAVQRFAFCDGLLAENPDYSTVEVLNISRTLAKDVAFAHVRLKLHFTLWLAACILLLPLFYALPYYRQSVACAVKIAIDKNHLSAEIQKPIVFILPAKATA